MGTRTPKLNLYKPDINEVGWGNLVDINCDTIDADSIAQDAALAAEVAARTAADTLKANVSSLAIVATSGSYSDLINKPAAFTGGELLTSIGFPAGQGAYFATLTNTDDPDFAIALDTTGTLWFSTPDLTSGNVLKIVLGTLDGFAIGAYSADGLGAPSLEIDGASGNAWFEHHVWIGEDFFVAGETGFNGPVQINPNFGLPGWSTSVGFSVTGASDGSDIQVWYINGSIDPAVRIDQFGTVFGITADMVGADPAGSAAAAQDFATSADTTVIAAEVTNRNTAIGVETSRAETAEALLLPLAGGTLVGAILGANGSFSAPTYSFSGAPTTGMYLATNPDGGISVPTFAYAPSGSVIGSGPALQIKGFAGSAFGSMFDVIPNGNTDAVFYIHNDGGLFARSYLVLSGSWTGSATAAYSITPPTLDPAMFALWSDVSTAVQVRTANIVGAYNYSNLDKNANYTMSIESDGRIKWGVGSTYVSMDTGLSRIAAGQLAIGNATAGDFTGSLKLANVSMVNATAAQAAAAPTPKLFAASNVDTLSLTVAVGDCVVVFTNTSGSLSAPTDNGLTSANIYVLYDILRNGAFAGSVYICKSAVEVATIITGNATTNPSMSGGTFSGVTAIGAIAYNNGNGTAITCSVTTTKQNSTVVAGIQTHNNGAFTTNVGTQQAQSTFGSAKVIETIATTSGVGAVGTVITISGTDAGANTWQEWCIELQGTGNQNSPILTVSGTSWNGATSITDAWTIQNIIGTGSNPTSTLTLLHSGSSGAASVQVSSLSITGTLIDGASSAGGSGNLLTSTGSALAWVTTASLGFLVSPMTTKGDIIIESATPAPTKLGIGNPGDVLTVTSGLPSWVAPISGFANPMTTKGDMIIESAAPAPIALAIGATGALLQVASGLPAWTTTPAIPSGATGTTQSALDNSTALTTTAYVDRYLFHPNVAFWKEDFFAGVLQAAWGVSSQIFACDTGWQAGGLVGVTGGSCVIVPSANQNNPGQVRLTTGSTSGNGAVLNKVGANGLGNGWFNLFANAGWEFNIIAALVSTASICMRIGFVDAADSNNDPPTNWVGIEYNTANTGNTDTDFTWVSKTGASVSYSTANAIAADTSFHRFRIRSTAANTILMSVDGGTETAITSNIPNLNLGLFIQVFTRTSASKQILVDYCSWFNTTTRT